MDTASSPQIQESPHRMIQYVNRYRVGGAAPLTYNQYLDLDGVNDYLYTANSSGYDLSGSLEAIVKVAAADWTPNGNNYIFAKYETTGDERSWLVHLGGTGNPEMNVSADGSFANTTELISGNALPFTNGSPAWLRYRWDQSTGDGTLDTSTVSGRPSAGDWSQFATLGNAAYASIYNSLADLVVGARHGGVAPFDGKIYHAELRQGFGGAVLAQFNAGNVDGGIYQNVAGVPNWTLAGNPILGSD